MATVNQLERLQKLGFTKASKRVSEDIDRAKKMHIAYDNYDWIAPEYITKFNEVLKAKTKNENQYSLKYDKLQFTKVEDYNEAPPTAVLNELEKAVANRCFNYFEIATIKSVEERKDPILFGRIEKCGDRFVIAQWDDDVTVEMIREATDGKK